MSKLELNKMRKRYQIDFTSIFDSTDEDKVDAIVDDVYVLLKQRLNAEITAHYLHTGSYTKWEGHRCE